MPATVAGMPVDTKRRASVAGKASRASLTPEQREESARAAAKAAHSLVSYCRRVAARWADASDDERREARRVLREAGVIQR